MIKQTIVGDRLRIEDTISGRVILKKITAELVEAVDKYAEKVKRENYAKFLDTLNVKGHKRADLLREVIQKCQK